MNAQQFVQILESLRFENAFNPYADRCVVHDVSDAPSRRRRALHALLGAAVTTEIDSLWIGRDLGHRGGRRTGMALTDDMHLVAHAQRWGVTVERATKGPLVAERTAAVVWQLLIQVSSPVFLWNVFPLHPHEPADPFSNRSHKPHERRAGEELLSELVDLLRPKRLVAIGNDAANVARRLASESVVVQIRHPSYGGQSVFTRQVREMYGLPDARAQATLL